MQVCLYTLFIKPKRELKPYEVKIKQAIKNSKKRIDEGEKIAISVINLTEISNFLETYLPLDKTLAIEEFLIRSAKIISISKNQYFEALKIAKENRTKCYLDIYGYAKK